MRMPPCCEGVGRADCGHLGSIGEGPFVAELGSPSWVGDPLALLRRGTSAIDPKANFVSARQTAGKPAYKGLDGCGPAR